MDCWCCYQLCGKSGSSLRRGTPFQSAFQCLSVSVGMRAFKMLPKDICDVYSSCTKQHRAVKVLAPDREGDGGGVGGLTRSVPWVFSGSLAGSLSPARGTGADTVRHLEINSRVKYHIFKKIKFMFKRRARPLYFKHTPGCGRSVSGGLTVGGYTS